MATIEVRTWAELTAALNSAEDADIYMMNDIDLNDELPEGITNPIINQVRYNKVLNGNGHTIKNIHSDKGINVFYGYYNKKPAFNNVNFHNVYLTNSSRLFEAIELSGCNISADLVDSYLSYTQSYSSFTRCGITVNGYGKAFLNNSSASTNTKQVFTDCNIKINGTVTGLCADLQNSYLSGDFEITGTKTINLFSSSLSVINAKINSAVGIGGGTNINLLLINTDNLILPEGTSLPSTVVPCTTEELKSAQALRDKSFPIGVD